MSKKLIILCSWGATSSSLAKKVQQAAEQRGLDLTAEPGSTGEFNNRAEDCDVALLEPQVRHLKKEMTEIAERHSIPIDIVDQRAFALMDGNKVLDQVIELLGEEA